MKHLSHPSTEVWNQRAKWFESAAEPSDDGAYILGEQACALSADLQCAFCAGAWIAVIVLAATVIDAHLREAEGLSGTAKAAIDSMGGDSQLHNLRRRRNAIIHVNPELPAVTVDQQWTDRNALEREARDAVTLVFREMYSNPWV